MFHIVCFARFSPLNLQGDKQRETRREERIIRLIQALKCADKIPLKDAATLLGVSEMTIRRDLSAEPAATVLLGGYIVTNDFISDLEAKQDEKKWRIGLMGAPLINENDTVFIDCGTSTCTVGSSNRIATSPPA